jgi:hypothetical protein
MAARALAARLQNRFFQDHLVHNAIVHRPTYGKNVEIEKSETETFFIKA